MFYNSRTGNSAETVLGRKDGVLSDIRTSNMGKGWSIIAAVNHEMIFYNGATGQGSAGTCSSDGFAGPHANTHIDKLSTGWWDIVGVGGYLIWYKGHPNTPNGELAAGRLYVETLRSYSGPAEFAPRKTFYEGMFHSFRAPPSGYIASCNRSLIHYNPLNGVFKTFTLDWGAFFEEASSITLPALYSHLVTLDDLVFLYNGFTGGALVCRLTERSRLESLKEYPAGSFSTFWSHVVATDHILLIYKGHNGVAATGRIDAETGVFTQLQSYQ